MQRIKLLSSPYSFSRTWVGAVLYAVRSPYGGGWDVYFPHAIGIWEDNHEDAPKNVWFHCDNRVQLLPAIPSADKPRYTISNGVWAKVLPYIRKNAFDCEGCAYNNDINACRDAPACSKHTRSDKRDVIFVTAVEKW